MSLIRPALVVPTPEHVNRTLGDFQQLVDRLERLSADLAICFPNREPHVVETQRSVGDQIARLKELIEGVKQIYPEAVPLHNDFESERRLRRALGLSAKLNRKEHSIPT